MFNYRQFPNNQLQSSNNLPINNNSNSTDFIKLQKDQIIKTNIILYRYNNIPAYSIIVSHEYSDNVVSIIISEIRATIIFKILCHESKGKIGIIYEINEYIKNFIIGEPYLFVLKSNIDEQEFINNINDFIKYNQSNHPIQQQSTIVMNHHGFPIDTRNLNNQNIPINGYIIITKNQLNDWKVSISATYKQFTKKLNELDYRINPILLTPQLRQLPPTMNIFESFDSTIKLIIGFNNTSKTHKTFWDKIRYSSITFSNLTSNKIIPRDDIDDNDLLLEIIELSLQQNGFVLWPRLLH